MKLYILKLFIGALIFSCGVAVGRMWQWQIEKDAHFVDQELLPLAHFVSSYRDKEGYLPSISQFELWLETNTTSKGDWYFPAKPDGWSGWGKSDHDFIVGAWRGEWAEYYQSWDGRVIRRYDSPLHHEEQGSDRRDGQEDVRK